MRCNDLKVNLTCQVEKMLERLAWLITTNNECSLKDYDGFRGLELNPELKNDSFSNIEAGKLQ